MYCRNCGNEILDNAKFCTMCGTEVVTPRATQPNETEAQNLAETNTLETGTSSTNEAAEVNGAKPPVDNTVFATKDQAPTNLKAAVKSTQKRSRRPVQMLLLVALALALATSVAYAAYRVYTDVWVPYQDEQQNQQQAAQEEQQQNAQTEKDVQEAQGAYNGIIEEYTQALTEAKNGTLDYSGSSENATGISDKYPDVNSEPFPRSSGESDEYYEYAYALKDLNNDGINELLIGKDLSKYGAYRGSVAIYDIWTYQDGRLVEVGQGITRGDYYLRANNVIMSRGNGGAQVNVYTMMTLNKGKLYDVHDLDDNDISKSIDNWTKGEALEQDWPDDTSTTGKMTKYTKYDANGNVTDSGTCTLDKFSSMLDELSNKYPEDTSVEWKSISAE